MKVRIRLFAILRERAGADALELELPDDATVADAMHALDASGPLAGLITRLPVGMALNREFADGEAPLAADDELALIPPLSGGSQVHVRLTDTPLSVDDLTRAVTRPDAGAIVLFCGVTREVERLHYEAYREMAETEIADIAQECVDRHNLEAVAIEHRVGDVPLGEPSVVVAAAAAHRAEAFAGAKDAIDLVKARAPIWKREIGAGGDSRWVAGTPAPDGRISATPGSHAQAPAQERVR